MTTSTPTVLLFAYGTLQDRHVQITTFGRELNGRPDALSGYTLRMLTKYANLERCSDPDKTVSGIVYEITEQELAAADQYEADAGYRRISVTLRSGDQAWVYLVWP